MNDRLKKSGVAGLAVSALLVLAWISHRTPPDPPALDRIRVAAPSLQHCGLVFIAAGMGYFREAGIEVVLKPAIHGLEAAESMVEGNADLAIASEIVFVITALKSPGLAMVANVYSSAESLAVVGRRDRAVVLPRDLAGKRVGVTMRTSAEYFLASFLIRNEMPADAVTLVEVAPSDMVRSLVHGEIDAASTWEPVVTQARDALGGGATTFHSGDGYVETMVVFGEGAYVRAHPSVLRGFVAAVLRAEEFARKRPEEALHMVAAQLGVAPAKLRPLWDPGSLKVSLTQPQLSSMEDEARWAMERGYAETRPVPSFLPNMHLDALADAAPLRVTVAR